MLHKPLKIICYLSTTPSKLYTLAANTKKIEYEQRINKVENADFTPMVMSSSGGMGPQMSAAVKRLAQRIAETRKESYSSVICMLRCKIVFSTMRSALVCLRGSRSLNPRKVVVNSCLSFDTQRLLSSMKQDYSNFNFFLFLFFYSLSCFSIVYHKRYLYL